MPMKVLLIDDGKDMQKLTKMSLEFTGGHQVIVADNGSAGIQMAKEERPDIILLDVMMPGMDGYETCKRLHDNEKTKDIPVIFLTAKAQRKEVERGLQLGAIGYIVKPFEAMKLDEQVKKLLSNADPEKQF